MKKMLTALICAAALILCSCSVQIGNREGASKAESASRDFFAMDTLMSVTCYGDSCNETVDEAQREVERLDNMLSAGNENSEIGQINANGTGRVSDETAEMIERSLEIYEASDGAFDISIYPLMELWGFTTGEFRVPSQEEIDEALKLIGSDKIQLDKANGTVTLEDGQGIDLGGIAKGYTSTMLMKVFEDTEIVSGLVSLGGNVQCYNTKPDGSLWKCGIKDPYEPNNTGKFLGILELKDKAVITSGAYERYFKDEETGKFYHHILDPKTGYPADSGIISSTIVSADGALADALSTTCYILGVQKAAEYWRNSQKDFDMILMTEDDVVYITEPLKDSFTSDYRVEIIE